MSTMLSDKITKIKLNDKPNEMSFDAMVRWLCLCNAVAFIDKKAHDLGVDFNECIVVKPKIIRDFIKETFHSTRANLVLGDVAVPD